MGLHHGQPRLLWILWEKEGPTHTELATKLHVQPATITKMVQRMEQGIVTCGAALIAQLLKGCLDREIPILVETRGRELIEEDGSVIGSRSSDSCSLST